LWKKKGKGSESNVRADEKQTVDSAVESNDLDDVVALILESIFLDRWVQ
jgi:hypothetical protein